MNLINIPNGKNTLILFNQLKLNLNNVNSAIEKPGEVPLDNFFPEQQANKLASLETYNKHLYRPNTYLHKWWARRCGTTFRFILKQLVEEPQKRDFYEPGGLKGKTVLDPMIGGGTTLHEAIRMGANVIGADIDPIPYLQAKISLTPIPLKYIEKSFNLFLENLRDKLSPLYITKCPDCNEKGEIKFVLYGLRRKCKCQEVVFVDSYYLRYENSYSIQICPFCLNIFKGDYCNCNPKNLKIKKIIEKGTKECDRCHSQFQELVKQPYFKRYVPLVIIGFCKEHQQFFKQPDKNDLDSIKQAKILIKKIKFADFGDFQVTPGPKSNDLIRNGINSFIDLFTPRQLLYLYYSNNLLQRLDNNERMIFSLLISTSLEFNSFLCGYKGADIRRPGAIRHTFSHHCYSFPYTAAENNPIFSQKTSGTLTKLFNDRIIKAKKWSEAPVERLIVDKKAVKYKVIGEVDYGKEVSSADFLPERSRNFVLFQGDSRRLDIKDSSVDYVVTDPPYYNSVQYSDLANFFRVWLKLFLPDHADWNYDLTASAVAEKSETNTSKYQQILTGIFQECFRVIKKDQGRLVFTFHHWDPNAWTELTLALKEAGFFLVNRYIVFSENPISVHIRKLKAIKHDCILILKPKTIESKKSHWNEPGEIDCSDSYNFCKDCGTALGWFLNSGYDKSSIRNKWNALIGNKNGKTSR